MKRYFLICAIFCWLLFFASLVFCINIVDLGIRMTKIERDKEFVCIYFACQKIKIDGVECAGIYYHETNCIEISLVVKYPEDYMIATMIHEFTHFMTRNALKGSEMIEIEHKDYGKMTICPDSEVVASEVEANIYVHLYGKKSNKKVYLTIMGEELYNKYKNKNLELIWKTTKDIINKCNLEAYKP